MATTISATDPILRNLASSINATDPAELNDIVSLINMSPTLVSQLLSIESANSNVSVTFSSAGSADTTLNGPALNVLTPSAIGDNNTVATSGSFSAQQDSVTPAGEIVGDLARSTQRWLAGATLPVYYGNVPVYSIERSLATQFVADGQQLLNNFYVKAQIEGNEATSGSPPGILSGNIWFDDGAGAYASTIAIKQVERFDNSDSPYSPNVSFLGSQVWNTPAGQAVIASTLSGSGNSSPPINPLQIDWKHLSNFTVYTDEYGNLQSSTVTTDANGIVLNYATIYTDTYHETTNETDANGTLIASVSLDTSTHTSLGADSVIVSESNNNSLGQVPNMFETFAGNNNFIFLGDPAPATVLGSSNAITDFAGGSLTINGDSNILYPDGDTSSLTVNLAGNGNELVLVASPITIAGTATNTTVYGGPGDMNYGAGSGTVMLVGNATVSGGAAGEKLVVFGGSGNVVYNGQQEFADVIGGHSDTIHAGTGGGWFQGGSGGNNLIVGSNSGAGTVLQAGGSGDTIDGGSAGGCYFLAGSGNETLNGGNTAGTALFFLGSGRDLVNLGSGNSIVDTGTGQATVVGTGSGDVYGGTGGADLFTAVGGNTSVHGFRIGLDHVSGAGGAVVQGANTVVTLSNGGRIELLGVTTTAHLFG